MAITGLGKGIAEGLMYQQQRQDALDQQAQEMAIKNAMMRLNEQEFTYKQTRDTKEDILRANERSQAKEQQAYREAQNIIEGMLGKGYEGMDIAPGVSSYLKAQGIEPPTDYVGNVLDLKPAPEFTEKQKLAQRRIDVAAEQFAKKLDTQRQGQFSTLYRFLISQGYDPSDALAEAIARTRMEEVAPGAGTPSQTPEQPPAAPSVNMAPQGSNPLLDALGIGTQTPAGGAETGQMPGGSLLPSVSPVATANLAYKQAIAEAARLNSLTKEQRLKFDKEMNPLRKKEMLLRMEAQNARIAESEARVNRMKALLPYEQMMKKYGVQALVTREEIQKLNLQQKREDAEWQKQIGRGSAAAGRVQQQAETRAGTIFSKQTALHKEKFGVDQMITSYNAVLKSPPPSQDDPEYAQKMQQRQLANDLLPGLESRSEQIREDLTALDTMKKNNNRFRNIQTERAAPSGKPVTTRPPAVMEPTRSGATGLPRITPPPQSRRPGVQTTPKKETDADIMARLRKKYR